MTVLEYARLRGLSFSGQKDSRGLEALRGLNVGDLRESHTVQKVVALVDAGARLCDLLPPEAGRMRVQAVMLQAAAVFYFGQS